MTVSVDAVVYFNVIDSEQALCSVDDFRLARFQLELFQVRMISGLNDFRYGRFLLQTILGTHDSRYGQFQGSTTLGLRYKEH